MLKHIIYFFSFETYYGFYISKIPDALGLSSNKKINGVLIKFIKHNL